MNIWQRLAEAIWPKRSIENPSVPLTAPDSWFVDLSRKLKYCIFDNKMLTSSRRVPLDNLNPHIGMARTIRFPAPPEHASASWGSER